MSAVEDTRKVLQDFLAPELRELKARIEALEQRMGDRFAQVDKQFEHADRKAETHHAAVIAEIKGLENYNDLRERIVKLEVAKQEALHQ
jgi:hypothetical protein